MNTPPLLLLDGAVVNAFGQFVVGGNVVIPASLFPVLRWEEKPWGVLNFEDATMSGIASPQR